MENEININGTIYIPKDSIRTPAPTLDGMEYVLVRTYSASVFTGYLESRDEKEVVLRNARRIYYWEGAATLSQLSMEGTSKPENCKFPCEVDKVILTEAIEIIPMTEKAKDSVKAVKVWKE